MNNPLEDLLDRYELNDILLDNGVEELTVLRLLVAEGLVDLDNYSIPDEDS